MRWDGGGSQVSEVDVGEQVANLIYALFGRRTVTEEKKCPRRSVGTDVSAVIRVGGQTCKAIHPRGWNGDWK